MSNNFALEDADLFFYYFGISIGEVITFYVPYIFKYVDNYKIKNNKKKKCTKNNIIDYFFLLFINLLRKICLLYEFCFLTSDADFLFAIEAFDIYLITKFFLKYKYYIHHTITLIIILILSVIMDIMLGNFKLITIHSAIFIVIYSICEVCNLSYDKYMMDIKFHNLYNMIFIRGILDFFLTLIIFGVLLFIRVENNNLDILSGLETYNKTKIGRISLRILIGIVLVGICTPILELQTINKFNSNYIFVCYQINKLINILYHIENLINFLSIIPYIFEIIASLFYLEIFEFNFCNLNKNTKKNILLREMEENIDDDNIEKNDNLVELKYGYYITNKEDEDEVDEKSDIFNEKR